MYNEKVSELLNEHNITHEMKGRSKSIYSIYNKMTKGKKYLHKLTQYTIAIYKSTLHINGHWNGAFLILKHIEMRL